METTWVYTGLEESPRERELNLPTKVPTLVKRLCICHVLVKLPCLVPTFQFTRNPINVR